MKKFLTIVLAVGLTLTTVGCGAPQAQQQVTETTSAQSLSQATTQPPTTAADTAKGIVATTTAQQVAETTSEQPLSQVTTQPPTTAADTAKSFVAATTETTNNDSFSDNSTTKTFVETTKPSTDDTELNFEIICGGWESSAEGGSYYVFKDDKRFYWYKSATDLNDNYYSGTLSVLSGYEAIADLGLNEAGLFELTLSSKGQITPADVYSLTMTPTYLISGGIDKTDTLQGSLFKMLFIYVDENSAQGYSLNTGDTYYFIKNDKSLEQ